jgi:hypothetical protein
MSTFLPGAPPVDVVESPAEPSPAGGCAPLSAAGCPMPPSPGPEVLPETAPDPAVVVPVVPVDPVVGEVLPVGEPELVELADVETPDDPVDPDEPVEPVVLDPGPVPDEVVAWAFDVEPVCCCPVEPAPFVAPWAVVVPFAVPPPVVADTSGPVPLPQAVTPSHTARLTTRCRMTLSLIPLPDAKGSWVKARGAIFRCGQSLSVGALPVMSAEGGLSVLVAPLRGSHGCNRADSRPARGPREFIVA